MCICICLYTLWRKQWQPTLVLLPGKSHGQGNLVGCSPWGCKESDMTEWFHFTSLTSYFITGEGNGNPLLYSCLENPMDRGAWWSMAHGVAESWTQLKWLSMHIYTHMHACVLSWFSHVWLCDPMDCSPSVFSVHEILEAITLECVAMPYSKGSSQPRDQTCISCGSCLAGGFFVAEPCGRPHTQNPFMDYTLVVVKGLV